MSELHGGDSDSGDRPNPAADASQHTGHEADHIPDSPDARDAETVAEDEEPLTRGEYADTMRQDTAAGEPDSPDDTDDSQEPESGAEEATGRTDLAEPRTRYEVAEETSASDVTSHAQDEALDHGADLGSVLAEQERLPEPRTRQEAAVDADSGDSRPATVHSEHDAFQGDAADVLPAEQDRILVNQDSPAPSETDPNRSDTDHGPGTTVTADVRTSNDSNPDRIRDGEVAPEPEQSDTDQMSQAVTRTDSPTMVSSAREQYQGFADAPQAPGTQKVIVHSQQGLDVPITVVHTTPEDRTLGDDTPTGAGLKPSGDDLLRMEAHDSAERRTDRLIGKLVEHGDDVHDGSGDLGEAIEADVHRDPGSDQQTEAHAGYPAKEEIHSTPYDHSVNDAAGALVMTAIAGAAGLRKLIDHFRKDRNR